MPLVAKVLVCLLVCAVLFAITVIAHAVYHEVRLRRSYRIREHTRSHVFFVEGCKFCERARPWR